MKTNNFIETYSNVLTQEECKEIIDYFEEMIIDFQNFLTQKYIYSFY
jgi:hypothetical protein